MLVLKTPSHVGDTGVERVSAIQYMTWLVCNLFCQLLGHRCFGNGRVDPGFFPRFLWDSAPIVL